VAEVTHIERNPDSPFARIIGRPIAGIKNNRQILLLGIPHVEPSAGKVINTPQTPDKQVKPTPPVPNAAR
jgi:rod shape-determining protein MreC